MLLGKHWPRSWQAKKISHEFLAAINNKEQNIPKAKTNARAAQMLAEMLAIVCHPEYYQQGEQTVPHETHVKCLTCRPLSSTLPVSKLLFTGQPFLLPSSVKFIPEPSKINSINHCKSNILDPVISLTLNIAQRLFLISLHLSAM